MDIATPPADGKSSPLGGGLLPFFSKNPWLGLAGSLASIISLSLAAYLAVTGRDHPGLTYSVNPARTVVAKTDQTSRLAVLYDGAPIGSDISAAQIAIWNGGRTPIDKVLKPLVISLEDQTRILEATIRRETRDVVNLAIEDTDRAHGNVSVRWDILEKGDGGVIQLIYAGGPDTKISAAATVVGQNSITYADANPHSYWLLQAFGLGGLAALVFWIGDEVVTRLRKQKGERAASLFIALLILLTGLAVIGLALDIFRATSPPFGF